MKKIKLFLCSFVIFMLFTILLPFAEQKDEDGLVFHYAFLYKKSNGTEGVVNPGLRYSEFQTGDYLKIYLKPVTRAYIYLYLYNSEQDLSLIFPGSFTFFSGDYETGIPCFLPSEEKWYRLKEPSGVEEFHLLASSTRLFKLESLTNQYLSLTGVRGKEDVRAGLKQDILDMIKDMKNNMYRDLLSINERPVPFAGVVRALDDEAVAALEISVTGIYAKTIRIRH